MTIVEHTDFARTMRAVPILVSGYPSRAASTRAAITIA
jgi:hypothetical protein